MEIQRAFISLLGDNNDLVQDAASKGVAIVYEACSEDQREELVSSLLDTLLGNKPGEVKKVNENTKVFQEGELGKIPEGGNLSTYKELCSQVLIDINWVSKTASADSSPALKATR